MVKRYRSFIATAIIILLLAMQAPALGASNGASVGLAETTATAVDGFASGAPIQVRAGAFQSTPQRADPNQRLASVQLVTKKQARRVIADPCWTSTWSIYGNDVFGFHLWGYFQKIDWCATGSTITSVSRTRWGEVYATSWEFVGHIQNAEEGGVGYSTYRAYTQGHFQQCLGFCFDHYYPWMDMTVHTDGTVTGSGG